MRITIPFVIGAVLSFFSIKSQAQNCVASFTVGSSCTNTVLFTNQSTPTANAHYTWNFGDGTANSTQTNPSHTFPNAGNYTVCLVIQIEGCANDFCQTVGVGDTQEPVFSNCRIASRPVNTDPGQCDAVVNLSGVPAPTATDNCDNSLTYSRSPSGNVFPIGETVVTITATDDAGNSASCDYLTVKVSDREPPVFDCSETNYTTTPDAGQCYATLIREDIEPPVSDNCSVQNVTQSGFPTNRHFPVGITKVTFIAIDDSGNRDTCTVNVEVKDNIPPTVTCPQDSMVTASVDSSGATVNFLIPNVSDGCTSATYTFLPKSGSFFNIGTTPITLTAMDAAGNKKVCTFNVIVKKVEPICKAAFNVLKNPCGEFSFLNQSTGAAPLTYLWTFGDGTTSTAKDPTHTYAALGSYTMNLQITDANGCISNSGASVLYENTVTIDPVSPGDSCCYALDFNLPAGVYGIEGVLLTAGVTFSNLQYDVSTGLVFSSSATQFSLKPNLAQIPISANFYDNLVSFCFNNVTTSPQKLVIRYLKRSPVDGLELLCADTLLFECRPKTCCDQNKVIAQSISNDPCCFRLSIENYCKDKFRGVCLQGLNGVDFGSSFTTNTGWVKYTFGPDKIVLDAPGVWISDGVTTLIGEICLDNFSSIPQEVEVVFLDNNYKPTDCKKKVSLECPVISHEPRCLIPVKDTMICKDGVYTYTFNVCNQSNPGFTINYIEIIPASGFTVSSNVIQIPGGLTAGNCTTTPFSITVSGPNAVAFNNFCFNLAGHNNNPTSTTDPPSECCTDTTSHCIKLPKCCTCDDITAIVLAQGDATTNCCYQIEINNQYCEKITKIVGTLSGSPATFNSNITSLPGWTYNLGSGNTTITYQSFPPGDVPVGISKLPAFCLDNYSQSQSLLLQYYGIENGVEKVICEKKLILSCPPEPKCDSLVNTKLVCLPNGDYQFSFQVYNNSSFTLNQVTLYPSSPAFPIPPINVTPTISGGITPVITITIPGSQLTGATQFCLKVHIGQVQNGIEVFCCTNPNELCIPVPPCGCKCGEWENFLVTLPGQPNPIDGCGKTFDVYSGQFISVNWNYHCTGISIDSCDVQYFVQVTQPTTNGGTTTTSYTTTDPFLNTTPKIPGQYCYTVTPICNGKKCEPCRVCFNVKPNTDECECGEWAPLGVDDPVLQISYALNCGKTLNLECDVPYTLFGTYECVGDTCTATYDYTIVGPPGFRPLSVIGATTLSLPLNFSMAGVYTLSINVHCGGRICPCVVTFNVNCPKPCICDSNSYDLAYAISRQPNQTAHCGDTMSLVCDLAFHFDAGFHCKGTDCPPMPTVDWVLKDQNGVPIQNGSNLSTLNITDATFPHSGVYSLMMTGHCGSDSCTCTVYFKVPSCGESCTCDETSFDLAYAISRGPITPVSCSDTMAVVCDLAFSFYSGFDCTGSDCPTEPKVDWMLIDPDGGTVQSGNTLTTLAINPGNSATIFTIPGTYTLMMAGYCGSDTCRCKVYFKVPRCSGDCIDFEHDEMASDWTQINLTGLEITGVPGNPINPPSNPIGNVLHVTDGSGGSFAVNNIDFAGNWLDIAEDGCLCFDYMVVYNAAIPLNGNPTAPKIGIYTGPPITSSTLPVGLLRATFVGNSTAIKNGEWDRYCLPLGLCTSGNIPSNAYGTWVITIQTTSGTSTLTGAAACTAWDNIIQNVTGLIIYADYNSQPSEEVYFDNFCWNCDGYTGTLCDSLMVMLEPVATSKPECCYQVNINNKTGVGISQIVAEVITPGWSFNTASLLPGIGYTFCATPTNQQLCVTHNSGTIPTGVINNFLKFCLVQLPNTTPSPTQEIVFSWYQQLPNGDSVICRDTLRTFCDIVPMPDTCLSFIKPEVKCNPDNPSEYTLNFQVTNNTGYDIYYVGLNAITSGFSFESCTGSSPSSFITIPTSPSPLPNGSTSNPLCVKIVSSTPITAPTQVCFRMKMVGLEDCCHSPVTYCVTLKPCSPCCTDSLAFVDKVNKGFAVSIDPDNCKVTVTAPQFDSCHWFGSPPYVVGGNPVIQVLTPTTGSWMFTFPQSGTYEICTSVYEGENQDSSCWNAKMCTKVTVNCSPCCKDSIGFINKLNQGFQITKEECKVTVTTTQFDSCHFATVPDFGDGTPVPRPLVSANGMWMHVYNQPGTYVICSNVFEQGSDGNVCWQGKICDTVTVSCPPGNCDSLDMNIHYDNSLPGQCCWKMDLDNQYGNHITSIVLTVTNATFLNPSINLPGWNISTSGTTAVFFPPGGILPEGNYLNAISFCLNNITGVPQVLTAGWYVPNPANPAKDTLICPKEFRLDCTVGCNCGQYNDLFFYERGIIVPVNCNNANPVEINCPLPGYNWEFYGKFACNGNCPAITPITWELYYTSGITSSLVTSGIATASPMFGITLLNSYFLQNGNYEIRLISTCGDQRCTCVIKMRVKACLTDCSCDKVEFEQAVAEGFETASTSADSCQACFQPRGLTNCDEVIWLSNGNIFGTSVGNQVFCYRFPSSGVYNITMMVVRHDSNGNICMGDCWDDKFEQQVTIACGRGLGTSEAFKLNHAFDLHPNPTNQDVTLTFKDWTPTKDTKLQVLDIHGRLLFEEPIASGIATHLLKLRQLPSGIYLIKIMENNIPVGIGRVVKQTL